MNAASGTLESTLVTPLLRALRSDERRVRAAALRALVRLPLSPQDWVAVGGYLRHVLTPEPRDEEPSYAVDRSDLFDAAAFVPTRGVRDRVLEIAEHGIGAERSSAIEALVRARDPRAPAILLARLRASDSSGDSTNAVPAESTWLLETLASCDLSGIEEALPELRELARDHPSAGARFWLSVALGRAGHAGPFVAILREIAEGRADPEFLFGSPFRVAEDLARLGPYPEAMRNIFKRVAEDDAHRMQTIFGNLLEKVQPPPAAPTRQRSMATDELDRARARAARAADELEPALLALLHEDAGAGPSLPAFERAALRDLEPSRATSLVTAMFRALAARAHALQAGESNAVAQFVADLGAAYTPEFEGLFSAFREARGKSIDLIRHIAWAATREGIEPVLRAMSQRLGEDDAEAAAAFIEWAAVMAGAPHPPYFGSGPGMPDPRPAGADVADLLDDTPREGMMANGGGQRAEPPTDTNVPEPWASAHDASSPARARVVNTGFCPHGSGAPGHELTRHDPLRTGARYRFWIEVGLPRASSIEVAPADLPREHMPAAASLTVALFAFPGEIEIVEGEDVGHWRLQPDGSVAVVAQPAPVPEDTPHASAAARLFFPVRAPRREGVFRLRCSIYHDQVLLQSRLIEAAVLDRPGSLDGALRSTVDYTIGKALDPARLAEVQPHRLSMMLNDNGDGTHGFRFLGADEGELFKNDATLDGVQLGRLVRQARGALRLAAWGDEDEWVRGKAYRYAAAREADGFRGDLVRMAVRGRRFYAAVISALSGGRPKADALAKLMRTPGLVQVAKKQSARHVVPVSLFYDYPFDTNAVEMGAYTLCPSFLEAMRGAEPLEDTACFRGGCPLADDTHNRNAICPSGFWGFRHALGLPLSVPSAPDPPSTIAYHTRPEFAVGVSTDPDFTLRAEHEKRLRALQPSPIWNYADSRDGVLTMLRGAHPHVVYLYCHGGVSNDVPFLVVGHDDPVITPDNLFEDLYWGDGTRPLVFINGCHTTALEPESALEFVTAFVDNAAAAGVVGTEITIFEPLARAFAEDCLRRFLAGTPIGESVRRTRLGLLKEGNPLGLVYIPFVTPGLRLSNQET